jgi:hypothetical protein
VPTIPDASIGSRIHRRPTTDETYALVERLDDRAISSDLGTHRFPVR